MDFGGRNGMGLQEELTKQVNAMRRATFESSDQLSLGAIIKKVLPIAERKEGEDPTVRFDFGNLFPTYIDSWRGSYNELALNYTEDYSKEKPKTITEFLMMLKEAIGKTYTGYKGGEYVMDENTPVWVANYGQSGDTAVIDIIDEDYEVIIITGRRKF